MHGCAGAKALVFQRSCRQYSGRFENGSLYKKRIACYWIDEGVVEIAAEVAQGFRDVGSDKIAGRCNDCTHDPQTRHSRHHRHGKPARGRGDRRIAKIRRTKSVTSSWDLLQPRFEFAWRRSGPAAAHASFSPHESILFLLPVCVY